MEKVIDGFALMSLDVVESRFSDPVAVITVTRFYRHREKADAAANKKNEAARDSACYFSVRTAAKIDGEIYVRM